MKNEQIALRYASALYDLASEAKSQSLVYSELKALKDSVFSVKEFSEFMTSPLIKPSEKEKVLSEAFSKSSVSDVVKTFCLLLAKKERLILFSEIVDAYQKISDEKSGVVRGVVRASHVLGGEEQKAIHDRVQKVTHKKPELTFEVDPELIGGLKAQVGSYTFDDSLLGHLRRMKEQLNRSAH